jgi:3-hydroxy-D-aspartate aldolase
MSSNAAATPSWTPIMAVSSTGTGSVSTRVRFPTRSVDSGLPFVYGRVDVKYIKCSDEHGVIDDPRGVLKINEKLRLVPGHCDPTCNVHDWYVGIRKGKVETLWPIAARGKAY